jgi:hypothetical protein
MSDVTQIRSGLQFWAPETPSQIMSDPTEQCPTESFRPIFVHCFGYILLTGCPINPIFSVEFITSKESFLHCWLVCSSPSCSVLALGFELGIYVISYKRIWLSSRSTPLRLPPSVLHRWRCFSDRGHLGASMPHDVSDVHNLRKRKKATRRGSASGKAPHQTSTSRRAPRWSSTLEASHGRGSTLGNVCGRESAQANEWRVLLDSEAGTFGAGPSWLQNAFHKWRYSPSTGMDINKWQVIFE